MDWQCIDEIKEVATACTLCSKKKVKCDRKRPCGRCIRRGCPDECFGEDEVEPKQKHKPHGSPVTSTAMVPLASAGQNGDVVDPENPLAFPTDPLTGLAHLVGPVYSKADPAWPSSLMRVFNSYRIADEHTLRILRNLPPKLASSVRRVFTTIDKFFSGSAPRLEEPPSFERKKENVWQHSQRCGMQAVRTDANGWVMAEVDVNSYWTGVAGLHREEYMSRCMNGDMNINTSELRHFCKIVFGVKHLLLHQTGNVQNGTNEDLQFKPMYSRISREWGRGADGEGLLVRVSTKARLDEEKKWLQVSHTSVVVTPEEYESVRMQSPEQCESYLVPIVGSKSAYQLMDPALLQQESFAGMSSTEEGRRQLDMLADKIDSGFEFLYDFFAAKRSPEQAQANTTAPALLATSLASTVGMPDVSCTSARLRTLLGENVPQ